VPLTGMSLKKRDLSVSRNERSLETLQILPTQEYNFRTAHVYNYFPKRKQLRRSQRSSKSDRTSNENFENSLALINQKFPMYTEKSMHFYMPRLTFNHSAEATLKSRHSTACLFVTNNKSYLQRKGFDINALYSFRQRHSGTKNDTSLDNNYNLQMPKFNSGDKTVSFKRRSTITIHGQTSGKSEFDKKSELVIDSPTLVKIMRGLERDTKIPGYIRADDTNRKILGKVLTKAHRNYLLNQKEPVIPEVFYNKS
jgi:hypothetical protein